jgi:uncharacterized membrane protein
MTFAKRRDMETRFALLEDRVFKIELRLGPETEATGAEIVPAPVPAQAVRTLPRLKIVLPAPQAVPPPLPRLAVAPPPAAEYPPQLSTIPYASPAPPEPLVQSAIERTIGLKWTGWFGAILLVAGAAFAVKFGYDKHWFGQVPPAVWLSVIFVAGLALIAVGEVIYRRVHIIPAASVFGAGVGTLFLAGYVGHAYYDLYSPGTALFLMAAAALVGALVAMRGNLVSIAVLSLLGANLAPLLVGSRSAPLESFLVYLLALQLVALRLASWGRGKKWWTLRGLSLASTALWVIGIGLQPGHESLVFLFSIFYAVLYHGELILSAMRRADDTAGAPISPIGAPDAITFALLVTAALTLVVLWSTRPLEPQTRAGILLAFAGASGITAWILARIITQAPPAIQRISIAHRIAAAGLVALAVPVAFSGLQTDLAWGLLALAFAVAGAATQSRISRTAAVAVWGLGVLHLAIKTQLPPELGGHPADTWFHLFGTPITGDAGLAFGLSVIGQIIAAIRVVRQTDADRSSLALSGAAAAVWLIASVLSLPPLAATAWIVEYAWLLVAAEAMVPQLRFSLQAAALILAAAIKWVIVDTVADRLSPGWSAFTYRPVLNPMMGIGTLICASILTLYYIRRSVIWRALRREGDPPARSMALVLCIVAGLVAFGLSFEIDRLFEQMRALGSLPWPLWQAKQLGWTIAWSLACAGTFALLRWRDPDTAPTALWPWLLPQILILLAVKFLTIDTVLARLLNLPANVTPLANIEASAGATILASLTMLHVLGLPASMRDHQTHLRRIGGLIALLVLLLTGSIEIDRYFAATPALNGVVRPEQVAISIYWSIFAVACVLLGFRIRAAGLRYFGLALLAITLLKVVLIDMSQVQTGYRILSFMALGGLLLGTSVLYGKLGPLLLRDAEHEEESQVSIG